MKKGIVATITIYSLVQILSFLLIASIGKLVRIIFYNPNLELLATILMVLCFIFISIGFVLLGYHLNKKYREQVTYAKYALVGLIISFISSLSFFLFWEYFQGKRLYGDFSWSYYIEQIIDDLNLFLFIIGLMTLVCLIVAIFHKKYKRTPKTNTESLNPDLLNN